MLLSVALNLPHLSPLTYQSEYPIAPGTRVLVPLAKRIVTGIVVPITPEARTGVRPIVEVLDDEPTLPPSVLELTRRVSEYYLCSWGEALFAAIPSGLAPGTVVKVEPTRYFTDEDLATMATRAPRRTELLQYIQSHEHALTVQYLQKQLKSQSVSEQLDALHRGGYISITTEIETDVQPRTLRGVVLSSTLVSSAEDSIAKTFDDLDKRAPKQSLALGQLYLAHRRGQGALVLHELCTELGISTAVVMALADKGLAEIVTIPKPPHHGLPTSSLLTRDECTLPLTPHQQQAVQAVKFGCYHSYVLDGVTGSGKTLVYMRLMEQVLRRGKGCLLLVPEIALTPQLHDRFAAVFGTSVFLLHSRMSMVERVTTWQRIAGGEACIVIGPRSAVFAPLHNIGLVVVDEEHEPSYKQDDPAPRYHGRDVAVMRAVIEDCPVVLGSATPSLESLYNVANGRYQRLVLPERTDGAMLPTITVVPLADERKHGRMYGTLSTTLVNAIRTRIDRSEGTILFLNRRGYASQQCCSDCGHVASCPHCDVRLTWHKKPEMLRCHYCGYTEPVLTVCTTCGGMDLRDLGIGIQQVEEDLIRALETLPPNHPKHRTPVIARMDSDTMRKQHAHRKLLERFANGDVDVIVGTQMVAKGLDIPRVTLVGVVLADQGLYQADFRAGERTLQLLYQVAGRAGRSASHPGEVMIQTMNPAHAVIQTLVTNSLPQWQHAEMGQRKETLYPPYSRFISIEMSGMHEGAVEHVAKVLDRLLPSDNAALVKYPPVVPSVAWIRNRHRRIIVLKNPKSIDISGHTARGLIQAALTAYYERYAERSVRVTVDVDSSGSL